MELEDVRQSCQVTMFVLRFIKYNINNCKHSKANVFMPQKNLVLRILQSGPENPDKKVLEKHIARLQLAALISQNNVMQF